MASLKIIAALALTVLVLSFCQVRAQQAIGEVQEKCNTQIAEYQLEAEKERNQLITAAREQRKQLEDELLELTVQMALADEARQQEVEQLRADLEAARTTFTPEEASWADTSVPSRFLDW